MPQFFQHYWAPLLAAALGAGVAVFVILRTLQDSRRGRLASALGHVREREAACRKAAKSVAKARKRLEKLSGRADSTPPNQLLAAKDELRAAEETAALLNDQLLVVQNDARTIILEHYPPRRHAAMRRKYLGETT